MTAAKKQPAGQKDSAKLLRKRRGSKRKRPARKAGGQTKFKPENVDEAHKLAIIGCSNEDIAWMMNVHPSTFRRWLKNRPKLCEAIKKGLAMRRTRLRKEMYDSAIKRHNVIMQIFLSKNILGMSDRQEVAFPDDPDGGENVLKVRIVHTQAKRTPASGEDPPEKIEGEKPKLKKPPKMPAAKPPPKKKKGKLKIKIEA